MAIYYFCFIYYNGVTILVVVFFLQSSLLYPFDLCNRWWYSMPGFYPLYNFREPDIIDDIIQDDICDFEISGFCHLCHILNNEVLKKPAIVPDLREAFYGRENSECYV